MIHALTRSLDFPNLYPDSDGKLMADNTLQYRWIVLLVSNLKHLFRGQKVFVAGDLLWYPQQVTAPPAPAQAPDAMVVFGRSDGDRRSYKQWEEENIAPMWSLKFFWKVIAPLKCSKSNNFIGSMVC